MKRSAGLLLWRRSPDGRLEVLLGHPGGPLFARKDEGVWSVPKGEYLPGEEPLAAAYREFTEELGVAPPDGEPVHLGEVVQRSGKVVTVWAQPGDLDVTRDREQPVLDGLAAALRARAGVPRARPRGVARRAHRAAQARPGPGARSWTGSRRCVGR